MLRSNAQQLVRQRTDAAWLAGIYEGEGCLSYKVNARTGNDCWQLVVSMADADVLLRLQNITGVGTITPLKKRNPDWRDQFRWQVGSRDDIAFVVGMMVPYLCKRRLEKAMRFLEWYRDRRLQGLADDTTLTVLADARAEK